MESLLLIVCCDRRLAGIEVKNSRRVDVSDFKGLNALQSLTENDFICGVVLCRIKKEVVPFGKDLWAAPISNLWA